MDALQCCCLFQSNYCNILYYIISLLGVSSGVSLVLLLSVVKCNMCKLNILSGHLPVRVFCQGSWLHARHPNYV